MLQFTKVVFLSSCIFLLLIGCDKESVNNDDNGFPIQLTAVQDGRNVNLTWTETKVSTFVEYIVVRSTEPIPVDFEPTPFSQFVVERLDEFEDNEFVDANPLLAERIYYKVFVDIGDRFLQSQEAVLDYEVTILNRLTSRVEFNPITGMLYLYDGGTQKLLAYNYRTNESTGDLQTNTNFNRYVSGNNGNGQELYLVDNSSTLKVYDAFSLDLKANFILGVALQNIATNNDGHLYVSNNNFSNNLRVVDAESGIQLATHTVGSSNPFLYTWDAAQNEVAFVGNFEMSFLKFSDEGEITLARDEFTNSFPTNNGGHAISADKQFIMPYSDGSIYDKNLNLINTIGNGNSFFEDFAFSSDGTKVFTADNSFLRIQQFSWPDLQLEETYQFSYFLNRIFEDNGSLVVVGSINDFIGSKTVIETINY